ncbi:MAG: hypothetical protein KGN31_07645 [Betaproteobacteria bacterium]|nr:hypothetical protein [Betaproteobacteria bacterium]
MSRIDAYELLSCPYCQQVHREAVWGSINLNITPKESFPNKDDPRLCANCRMEIILDEMTSLGKIDSRIHYRYEDIFPSSRPLKQKIIDFFHGRKYPAEIELKLADWVKYPVIR